MNWNEKTKRLLKAELIKRGVTTSDLVLLLRKIGVNETKASIDSKISRGTFSANFLIQCLMAIGCNKIEIENFEVPYTMAAGPQENFNTTTNE